MSQKLMGWVSSSRAKIKFREILSLSEEGVELRRYRRAANKYDPDLAEVEWLYEVIHRFLHEVGMLEADGVLDDLIEQQDVAVEQTAEVQLLDE